MTTTIAFSALPPLNSPLECGIFSGVTTRKDGTHCAVVLLPRKDKTFTWKKGRSWAKKRGGELPTRVITAILSANVKPELLPACCWTAEEYDDSFAWCCDIDSGNHHEILKMLKSAAIAVRLIPLTA